MAMRLLKWLLTLAIVAGLGYWGYTTWSKNRAMISGDVYGDPGVSSYASDAQPEKRPEKTAVTTAKPVVGSPENPATSNNSSPTLPQTSPQRSSAGTPAAAVPAADTISPNPPNGMVFSGTGHFQVYRQGDITWRINTDTGKACILFATLEQWKKPIVYKNGCGR